MREHSAVSLLSSLSAIYLIVISIYIVCVIACVEHISPSNFHVDRSMFVHDHLQHWPLFHDYSDKVRTRWILFIRPTK